MITLTKKDFMFGESGELIVYINKINFLLDYTSIKEESIRKSKLIKIKLKTNFRYNNYSKIVLIDNSLLTDLLRESQIRKK